MKLTDLVEKLAAWTPKRITLPPTPRIVHESRKVAQRLRDIEATINVIDLKDLYDCLSAAMVSGNWGAISKREWKYVADCLNSGEPRLVDDNAFLEEYLKRLNEQHSRRGVSRLIRFYLLNFDPKHPGIIKIASFLSEAVMQWRWHWSAHRGTVDLFQPSSISEDLARYIMESKNPPAEAMETIGLDGSLYGAKIAAHSYRAAADKLRKEIVSNPSSSLPAIKRLASWGLVNGRFAFDSVSGTLAYMADALLLPWVYCQPTEESQSFIEGHLLSLLHDLRIDPSRWKGVNDDAKSVMRRWLTKASLEQFLDVVDSTAQSHMWAARRKFWFAYYENKFMVEAWVAFAADGARLARQLAAERDNPAIKNFGTLNRSAGVVKEHAVLIMKIGELVVADWSHNGKCHIWLPGDENAPKLYKRSYDRDELINGSSWDKKHLGVWQSDVHSYIQYNTGFRMMTRDYM